ncbi:hypothetical protein BH762_gp028 [Gordonia phage OneUp]|uniref:Uncharacterized protein n=1 Tax=Gordonia phage OneUp TaxID=1838074 RepID=A0A160DEX1_9CAUD|nr:hypothetical protein BH762_gp028 [Gordonia phage OneUp]ANA86490.1 hypothetical protein PBI_ONEUP_157 [Gordonia phage OneUp]
MADLLRTLKECKHSWVLAEGGYQRTWAIRVDPDTNTISAYDDTYSESGDGEYLLCLNCGNRLEVPTDWAIDWN